MACRSSSTRTGFRTLLLILIVISSNVLGLHLPPNELSCSEPSPELEKFIEPLTFPPVVDISDGQQVTIGAYKITQKLHRDLPNTTLYAFGTSQQTATFPGPTLLARSYTAAHVRWVNHIPDEHHFLPIGAEAPWADPILGGVPIVVHLHGAEVESKYDGNPDAWFTPRNETGPAYVTQDYTYLNQQPAAALWYHDHTMGITRVNVLAGLSGLYILRSRTDSEESSLPVGIPLVMKDWRFFANGSINLPGPGVVGPLNWCPEWYDTWLVNGKVWPYLLVNARQYRFRLLNACNARFTALYLSLVNNLTLPILQIGTDGGFLSEPRNLSTLLMSPSERADVLVDFSGFQNGTQVFLRNLPVEPNSVEFPRYTSSQTSVLMKFVVVSEGGTDEGLIQDMDRISKLPSVLLPARGVPHVYSPQDVKKVRVLTMAPRTRAGRTYQYAINNLTWEDPVTENPVVGSTEIWEVINRSRFPHPVHIHLIRFRVINQQALQTEDYVAGNCSVKLQYPEEGSCFTEYPRAPESYQQGWKDNVILWPFQMIRLLLRFTSTDGSPFPFDPTTGPGYAWHCHVVQHEDHSMMRPMKLHFAEAELADDAVSNESLGNQFPVGRKVLKSWEWAPKPDSLE